MSTTPKGIVQGISELALWVNDLDGAVQFYTEHLGFELDDATPGRNAFLRSGDLVLALFAPVAEGNTAVAAEYLQRYGGPRGTVYHLGFKVQAGDLDAQAERLRAAGVAVKGPMNFATGRRSYFFEDPDQHFIELTDR